MEELSTVMASARSVALPVPDVCRRTRQPAHVSQDFRLPVGAGGMAPTSTDGRRTPAERTASTDQLNRPSPPTLLSRGPEHGSLLSGKGITVKSVLVCLHGPVAEQAVSHAAAQLGLSDVVVTAVGGSAALTRVE